MAMRLEGCLDPRLNGMGVRLVRPMNEKEKERFRSDRQQLDWVWIDTKHGRSFVVRERVEGF
jgi:hypothetical protein